MKKLIIATFLLCSFLGKAQEKEVKENTVTVSGRTLVERTITLYKAKITLNMEQLYYSDPSTKTLDNLKKKYFQALKENTINPEEFKEKEIEFLTYGYQGEGTIYEFETTSEIAIKNIAQTKMPGVTIQYQFKAEIKPEQHIKILEASLADARENAKRVCKVANKELGEVIAISDSALQQTTWNTYHSAYEEYNTINVTYKMN